MEVRNVILMTLSTTTASTVSTKPTLAVLSFSRYKDSLSRKDQQMRKYCHLQSRRNLLSSSNPADTFTLPTPKASPRVHNIIVIPPTASSNRLTLVFGLPASTTLRIVAGYSRSLQIALPLPSCKLTR
ncbi:hypothetical protein P153DRAFT_54625 [Dothidotthia symphoricarpi CBS 119687]|uniref:Uncharacterized protein n=1 Tax=Dothidotthia symphoricarpi CBS 119687 TaxID=1392245 RepID=A0A6A6A985_9PLEO|nr:uncharacterized protein P153DRAFT_54625 [Dothidotthia symphoricarpi CBS 119687]KAF2127745.1 hypothetical protein P153DRAFT_54625 [Dothidotthia symphoricarpi CBS 119687]